MSCRPFVSLLTAVTLVAIVPVARGELPHSVGRYLGTGWSDGYHSRAACRPKRHLIHHSGAATPSSVPWWKIPSTDAEELPHPAAEASAKYRGFPASGPSLFRQPGEGTPVTVASGPNTAVAR